MHFRVECGLLFFVGFQGARAGDLTKKAFVKEFKKKEKSKKEHAKRFDDVRLFLLSFTTTLANLVHMPEKEWNSSLDEWKKNLKILAGTADLLGIDKKLFKAMCTQLCYYADWVKRENDTIRKQKKLCHVMKRFDLLFLACAKNVFKLPKKSEADSKKIRDFLKKLEPFKAVLDTAYKYNDVSVLDRIFPINSEHGLFNAMDSWAVALDRCYKLAQKIEEKKNTGFGKTDLSIANLESDLTEAFSQINTPFLQGLALYKKEKEIRGVEAKYFRFLCELVNQLHSGGSSGGAVSNTMSAAGNTVGASGYALCGSVLNFGSALVSGVSNWAASKITEQANKIDNLTQRMNRNFATKLAYPSSIANNGSAMFKKVNATIQKNAKDVKIELDAKKNESEVSQKLCWLKSLSPKDQARVRSYLVPSQKAAAVRYVYIDAWKSFFNSLDVNNLCGNVFYQTWLKKLNDAFKEHGQYKECSAYACIQRRAFFLFLKKLSAELPGEFKKKHTLYGDQYKKRGKIHASSIVALKKQLAEHQERLLVLDDYRRSWLVWLLEYVPFCSYAARATEEYNKQYAIVQGLENLLAPSYKRWNQERLAILRKQDAICKRFTWAHQAICCKQQELEKNL